MKTRELMRGDVIRAERDGLERVIFANDDGGPSAASASVRLRVVRYADDDGNEIAAEYLRAEDEVTLLRRHITVRVENTYACGRESESTETVRSPAAGEDIDEWADVHLHDATGDGHPCGASENALYEATITEAPDHPELVGQKWEFGL